MVSTSSHCLQTNYTRPKMVISPEERCAHCGILKDRFTIKFIEVEQDLDYAYVCESCYNKHYAQCAVCGIPLGESPLGHITYRMHGTRLCLCKTCAYTLVRACVKCGNLIWLHEENPQKLGDKMTICKQCARYECATCAFCGILSYKEDMAGRLCVNCSELNKLAIHEWDYKPRYRFFSEKQGFARQGDKKKLYLGIEMEYEVGLKTPSYPLRLILNPKRIAYYYGKHDGTITSGFELVSQPATYQWILDNFDQYWGDVFKIAKAESCRPRRHTAMHVHVSRLGFSSLTIYKIMKFFAENKDYIRFISNRPNNLKQHARIETDETNIKKYCLGKEPAGKYFAINIQHRQTIEFRIFKSTTNKHIFLRNIEFCLALREYVMQASLKDCANLDKFLQYARECKYQRLVLRSQKYTETVAKRGQYYASPPRQRSNENPNNQPVPDPSNGATMVAELQGQLIPDYQVCDLEFSDIINLCLQYRRVGLNGLRFIEPYLIQKQRNKIKIYKSSFPEVYEDYIEALRISVMGMTLDDIRDLSEEEFWEREPYFLVSLRYQIIESNYQNMYRNAYSSRTGQYNFTYHKQIIRMLYRHNRASGVRFAIYRNCYNITHSSQVHEIPIETITKINPFDIAFIEPWLTTEQRLAILRHNNMGQIEHYMSTFRLRTVRPCVTVEEHKAELSS